MWGELGHARSGAGAEDVQTDHLRRLLYVEAQNGRVCAIEAVADQGEYAFCHGEVAWAGLAVEAQCATRPVEVITT